MATLIGGMIVYSPWADNKENKDDDTSSVAGSERSEASNAKDGKPKKKVTWAVEKELRSYHYFELDETERGMSRHRDDD